MASSTGITVVGLLFLVLVYADDDTTSLNSSPCNFPAIFAFGDSNTDTGGIAAAFYPPVRPTGRTFFHRPVGRASDGRMMIDFIADHLGLPYLSSYLDSVGTSYRHGANFATGGATIMRPDESWFEHGVSPFSLEVQVEHYTQFKAKTEYFHKVVGTCKSRLTKLKYFSEALFVVDIGQNDLAVGLRRSWSLQPQKEALPSIIKNFTAKMHTLYHRGARFFWVHNTGPLGCLAVSMVKVQNPPPGYVDPYGCVNIQNEISMEFNRQLKNAIDSLRSNLSDASIIYVDMYRAKYQLISNAKLFGFEEPSRICCGYHGVDYDIWCGHTGIVDGRQVLADSCANPEAVISWDGVHYSEAANKWIVNQIADGSFSDPPVGIKELCLRTPSKLHK